jgi:hypothetical protein
MPYTPNTDNYSSTVNVFHLTGTNNANDGGTVKKGGDVQGTRFAPAVPVYENEREVFGSVVVDNNSADKALDAGTFSYNNQRPVGMKVTDSVSGVANDTLLSAANDPAALRSIHKLEVLRTRKTTTGVRENRYNRYTNRWEANYPQNVVDTLEDDSAANPTQAVPGLLTYMSGSVVPVNDAYKPKTN